MFRWLQYAPRRLSSARVSLKAVLRPGVTFFAALLLVCTLTFTFARLGFWQWEKAVVKKAQQDLIDARSREAAIPLPMDTGILLNTDFWRYRRVTVRGTYDAKHQVLLDNRVYGGQAGYHVLTPLRLRLTKPGQSDFSILVNRGWVPAMAEHTRQPKVETPDGEVVLSGTLVVPGTQFFMLGVEPDWRSEALAAWGPNGGGLSVWQHLDLARYRQLVNFSLLPMVLQLDAGQIQGGAFVCDWPRVDERVERHLSYAWQWFGFAAATLLIALFFALRGFRAWRMKNAGRPMA